jgi:hypothetical protein
MSHKLGIEKQTYPRVRKSAVARVIELTVTLKRYFKLVLGTRKALRVMSITAGNLEVQTIERAHACLRKYDACSLLQR